MPFQGFSKETIRFLFELGFHNDRDWFREHKPEYERHVLKPFQELVRELGPKMLAIDPDFEITPAVDKTISRIYRDTRFSKDKSPYRSNVWISFKRKTGDWKETPVYFFEIYPDYYHYGMGFFIYTPATREILRKRILGNRERFLEIAGPIVKKTGMAPAGEKFKRTKDKDVPEKLRQWYERKELYLYVRRDTDETLFSEKLVGRLYRDFLAAQPLYEFLWDCVP